MPIINIEISNVKRKRDNVTFIAAVSNKVIERTLNINDITNWTDFASWIINQEPDFELMPDREKLLEITFHNETITDPETGIDSTIRVVDNVDVT